MSSTHGLQRVCVLGASGRLGTAIVKHLSGCGINVRAACRNPRLAARMMGSSKRVQWAVLDAENDDRLRHVIQGCDATVFAIGANRPCYAYDSFSVAEFRRVNVELLSRAAEASLLEGNGPFVHLGSLFSLGMMHNGWITDNLRPNPASSFEKSERDGELRLLDLLQTQHLNARILRLPPILGGQRGGGLLSNLFIASQTRDFEQEFRRHENTYKPAMWLDEMLAILEVTLDPELRPFTCNLSSADFTLKDVLGLVAQHQQRLLTPPKLQTNFVRFLSKYLPYSVRIDPTRLNHLRHIVAKTHDRPDNEVNGANNGASGGA